jgi:hypothetical protein
MDSHLRKDFERLVAAGGTSFLMLAQSLRPQEGGPSRLLGDAMADRQLAGQIAEIDRIRDEIRRFESSPAGFRASPLGRDLADLEELARKIAERNANDMIKDRYARLLAELEEHLRDADKLLTDLAAAERGRRGVSLSSASPPTSLV